MTGLHVETWTLHFHQLFTNKNSSPFYKVPKPNQADAPKKKRCKEHTADFMARMFSRIRKLDDTESMYTV